MLHTLYMTPYFYAALIGLVSILAVALSARALRYWDNLGPPEINPPWWRTWKRPAFSIAVAFLLGALAELSKVWAPTASLFTLTHAIMPFLYSKNWRCGPPGYVRGCCSAAS
jgi:hypothetical protein